MSAPTRFLILPPQITQAPSAMVGLGQANLEGLASPATAAALRQRLHETVIAHVQSQPKGKGRSKLKAQSIPDAGFDVVASVAENGVQLVSTTPEMASAYRFDQPGARVVPEVFYKPAQFFPRPRKKAANARLASTVPRRTLEVEVVRMDDKKPVSGVRVTGFTDFENRVGHEAFTKSTGKVTLSNSGGEQTYERLYVRHELPGLWSHLLWRHSTQGQVRVELRLLDLTEQDSLQFFHTPGDPKTGQGVKVGVVDTGIALNHPDLVVAGGLGCVPGEPNDDWGPLGGIHGTHVAGIIAGRGEAPTGVRGIAPGVELFSYRVFGQSTSSGSNFAVVQAIERGVADGCDLLNLSLAFDPDENTGLVSVDVPVQEAIRKADSKGVLVIVAAGNDGRKAVSYPAQDPLAVAVSAVGRKGLFPADSSAQEAVMEPYGTDPKAFVAAFSNVGTEISVAGAGVAVVSAIPGGHAPMDGTSMACPAVAGVVARLLAQNHDVLNMPRDAARSRAIKKLLFDHARTLGFKIDLEGKGLPR